MMLVDVQYLNKKYLSTATIHMMAPMTTLNWSYPSLLESISTCMEIWMMMASMKVISKCQQFQPLRHLCGHILLYSVVKNSYSVLFFLLKLQQVRIKIRISVFYR